MGLDNVYLKTSAFPQHVIVKYNVTSDKKKMSEYFENSFPEIGPSLAKKSPAPKYNKAKNHFLRNFYSAKILDRIT